MNLLLGITTALGAIGCIWLWSRNQKLLASHNATRNSVAELERFLRLLRSLPHTVHVVRRDGAELQLGTDGALSYTGDFLERIPAPVHAELLDKVAAVLDSGNEQGLRCNVAERWLDLELFPVATGDKQETVCVVALRDATEEELTNENLERLANRNNAILKSSMDGFFVVGQDHQFIEVNDAFCRMTGYSGDEMLEMKISDLEAPEAPEQVPAHARTGLHQFPTAHRHRDGHIIHLEISMNVHRDDDGQRMLVGFARDITERRKAEEEFTRLSRQHRLILDSAAEGVFGVDTSGRTTFVNPAAARMLGVRTGELIGRSMHGLFCEPQTAETGECSEQCSLGRVLSNGGGIREAETDLLGADDKALRVAYSITPTYEGTQMVAAVIVFRDISERMEAEQERRRLEAHLQQMQRLESLGALAGGIAHDLNNMLVGVLGNACLAAEEAQRNEDVSPRLQRIITAGERASKIISQILAYSGHVTPDATPLELGEFVRETIELTRPNVDGDIQLLSDLPDALPLVDADHGQLQQVLSNLVINAAEAIGQRAGTIAIKLAPRTIVEEEILPGEDLLEGEFVELTVRDDGCGIPPDKLSRIFEPFFSQKGMGRGLGLAAMHGIVRAHGGAVRVSSEVGVGTTFRVLLPALPPDTQPIHETSAREIEGRATVLVIDDEEDVRDVVHDVLASRGMDVLLAEDGASGVAIFQARPDDIDLVLLDMTMPGMSGAEVFEAIRAERPDARVVVASGYAEKDVLEQLGEGHPHGFIHKPFTLKTLIDRVAEVLGESVGG